jgi:arginyl-tRNA synthetase
MARSEQLEELLVQRLAPAFSAVAGEAADPVVRRSQRADFQADGALALARRLGRSPREIAEEVVAAAALGDLCGSVEVAGPGFINMVLSDVVLGRLLAELVADDRLGVPEAGRPETVLVDYSSPNAAKEAHVGHLRSTIIGDAVVRLTEWLGHTVIRQNHLGDWGTPFGMLIEHLLDIGETEAADELSADDLTAFYQAARRKFDADEGFQDRSRRRVVLLQGGDEATLRLWRVPVEESKKYFMAVYARLGVRLTAEDFAGESGYNHQLDAVVEELGAAGLLTESDGAKCVFPEGFRNRDGEPLPLIVQKRGGGFGYATTDLATIRHRIHKLDATRVLYVVGLPQHQHLEMIFEVARAAGWLVPPARAEHIGFGSVLGPDGRMLRTRAGGSVRLAALLDEAVTRATAVVAQKNPSLDEGAREQVARVVGMGAVKYADLSTERTKDYVFDFDRMLSFDGNTAPYLQYAHARIRSIFRRSGTAPPRGLATIEVCGQAERDLALELLAFGGTIATVSETFSFHTLAHYLFGLATTFSSFYEKCPVLRAESAIRDSRLALCDLTARTLARGLDLLGIEAPDQM